MRTVLNPSDGKTYHIKCGGQIMGGVCLACGKREKGRFSNILHSDEPFLIRKKDPGSLGSEEYKKILRERLR